MLKFKKPGIKNVARYDLLDDSSLSAYNILLASGQSIVSTSAPKMIPGMVGNPETGDPPMPPQLIIIVTYVRGG